jgi:hypothetical protein
MPVLHVPTLRESAYNTPAKTSNSKFSTLIQKLGMTNRITEESHRHFWHANQGEPESDVKPSAGDRARSPRFMSPRASVLWC